MSLVAERQAIETRFATAWSASSFAATPVQYENTPVPSATSYVAVSILTGKAQPSEISSTGFSRNVGVIQFDIYVAADIGSNSARAMAEVMETAFYREQFSAGNSGTITVRTIDFRYLGVTAGRARYVLSLGYWRDFY